jgi:WD40 repeat protein
MAGEGGGIFVSYRRRESRDFAGRLYDRLADRFGEGQVFMDVDTIEPGVDFAEEISRAVAACQVLLAIIGPGWLTVTDRRGRRRLDDPEDLVRLEIGTALARNVRVIPVLVGDTVMPGRDELPESLAGLARRNAVAIRHENFRSDVGRLVTAIERVLATPGTAPVAAAAPRPTPVPVVPSHLARALTGHDGEVFGVAFSPDGRLLATTSVDQTVWLWDLASGEHRRTLTGHDSVVYGVAFSPDGRLLATTSADGTARLWDPATGGHLRALTGHDGEVFGVAFSPDGRLLATTSVDGTARLWDPATGGHLRTLTGHDGAVDGVAFSPDGRLLATTSVDATARLWD